MFSSKAKPNFAADNESKMTKPPRVEFGRPLATPNNEAPGTVKMSDVGVGRALVAAFILGWAVSAAAQVAVSPLTGRVVDQTATLTSNQKATLEQTLQAFEVRRGSQLAVLIGAGGRGRPAG